MPLTISVNSLDVNLEKVRETLRTGNCIGLPTETVYGLAADATNGTAVAKIFELKGRPKFNPLICHVSDMTMAETYGIFDPLSKKLGDAFWPGPLTLIVPLSLESSIHALVTAGLDTVGLRCPRGIAGKVIADFGKPLAAPSANRSGRVSPTTADHVVSEFEETDLSVIDAGPCDVGLESTIVKVEGNQIFILRPGSVTHDQIKDVTGIAPQEPADTKIIAPGMLKSHYAPDAQVVLDCEECDETDGWLQFGANCPEHPLAINLSPSGNLQEAAANLYRGLKALDAHRIPRLCVSPIPLEGLGIAINDRLRRAAAQKEST
ncbi:MAG: L-threonylcarbamoyladenylate synthase [Pseudomonadota bacterium]